ncbi:MAG: hypothetical protein J1E06_04165 [Acutalibacter sp.]|nr:hypothetical protein [Acutalibacter sp.]
MKRVFTLALSVLLLLSAIPVAATAASVDKLVSTSTEYFDDGSYAIIDVYESAIQPRTGKTGYAETTYYSANGTRIFKVTVTGSFEYTYGVSASATSATVSVAIYNSNTSFVSKNAYTSGASAVGSGTVSYSGSTITKTARVTCDKYGTLSYS